MYHKNGSNPIFESLYLEMSNFFISAGKIKRCSLLDPFCEGETRIDIIVISSLMFFNEIDRIVDQVK